MENNNKLLEKYLRNERINQKATTLMVLGFLALASVLIGLGLHTKRQKIDIENLKNEIDNEKLKYALMSDSLQRVVDLNKIIIQHRDNQLLTLLGKSDSPSNKIKEANKEQLIWDDGNKMIRQKLTLENFQQQPKVIYVQYKNQFDLELVKKLREGLQTKGFIVKQPEQVNVNFKSSIRYFHSTDQNDALRLRELLVQEPALINMEIMAMYNLKAPANQLEVWINSGENENSTEVGEMLPPSIEEFLPSNRIETGKKRN